MTRFNGGNASTASPPRSKGTSAHQHSVKISIDEIAQFLIENLGARLAGSIVGADRKTIERWAAGKQTPRVNADKNLRAAFQVFHTLMPVESPATIRAWFIGMNPQLDDLSPAEALADGRARDVMAAARAFRAGG